MRESILGRTMLLSLFALLAGGTAHHACAQRRGGGGGGFARGGRGFNPGFGRARGAYLAGFGSGYLPYDSGDAYGYEPQPAVYLEQPPVVMEAPAPPPRPVGDPVITEYTWPAARSASAAATGNEPAPETFGLVLKDGSTVSAVMVYAADDGLHYVDPDERHLCVSMSQVDRAATLKLNRERNLNLHLPAAQ